MNGSKIRTGNDSIRSCTKSDNLEREVLGRFNELDDVHGTKSDENRKT